MYKFYAHWTHYKEDDEMNHPNKYKTRSNVRDKKHGHPVTRSQQK